MDKDNVDKLDNLDKEDKVELFTALQHYGTMALWHYGTMALRHYGTTALRHYGTIALRHYSTAALRHYGTTKLRHYGTTALWHYYGSPSTPGIPGTLVPGVSRIPKKCSQKIKSTLPIILDHWKMRPTHTDFQKQW